MSITHNPTHLHRSSRAQRGIDTEQRVIHWRDHETEPTPNDPRCRQTRALPETQLVGRAGAGTL